MTETNSTPIVIAGIARTAMGGVQGDLSPLTSTARSPGAANPAAARF
jgi:hypothetical protein